MRTTCYPYSFYHSGAVLYIHNLPPEETKAPPSSPHRLPPCFPDPVPMIRSKISHKTGISDNSCDRSPDMFHIFPGRAQAVSSRCKSGGRSTLTNETVQTLVLLPSPEIQDPGSISKIMSHTSDSLQTRNSCMPCVQVHSDSSFSEANVLLTIQWKVREFQQKVHFFSRK